jgi:target of rapamycin complex 2 subunit MAPKAP1
LFNDPGIRAAGLADGIGIHRTYSPPIPVATAVASEYFKGPRKQARFEDTADGENDEARGLVTAPGSSETVGPRPAIARRRRREQQEEDDSSDLSDESDDDPEPNR